MSESLSPKSIEHSKYKELYKRKLTFKFGHFYIFNEYVVGEVNEGVHFNWNLAQQVIQGVYDHFGSRDIKVAYISNRIHSYSVQPKDWMQFFKERHKIKCIAVVAYNRMGWMSVVLEKIFSNAPIKKFSNINSAIDWVLYTEEKKEFPLN